MVEAHDIGKENSSNADAEDTQWHLIGRAGSWIWGVATAVAALAAAVDSQPTVAILFGFSAAASLPSIRDFFGKITHFTISDWFRAPLLISLAVMAGSYINSPLVYKTMVIQKWSSRTEIPPSLRTFETLIDAFRIQCSAATNDLAKASLESARDQSLLKNPNFFGWPATIESMSADETGNAELIVRPHGCACTLAAGKSLAPHPLIDTTISVNSPLYERVKHMRVGEHVIITGQIYQESGQGDGEEVSNPNYLSIFTTIETE